MFPNKILTYRFINTKMKQKFSFLDVAATVSEIKGLIGLRLNNVYDCTYFY